MPKAKQSDEGIRKMEHLMWLAQERPDHVYDLSACDAYDVPGGVYAMCKVLQKQILLLHSNHLQSLSGKNNNLADLALIQELDLHGNELTTLPDQVGLLARLKVLNVAHNKLKSLPDSLTKLTALQSLDVSENKLTHLPAAIHQLSSLNCLLIVGNGIKKLPVHLCKLSSVLVRLELDSGAMQFPPSSVCQQGIEAIMRYLCSDIGHTYEAPCLTAAQNSSPGCQNAKQQPAVTCGTPSQQLAAAAAVAASVMEAEEQHRQYELANERRRNDLLERERRQAEEDMKLARLVSEANAKWRSNVASIATEASVHEESIAQLQFQKEAERKRLLTEVAAEERYSAQLVADIMAANETMKKNIGILEEMEKERLAHEQLFVVKAEELKTLRKRELFEWMQASLVENTEFDGTLDRLAKERRTAVQQAKAIEDETSGKLAAILAGAAQDKSAIAMELLTEERWQMEAVGILLKQRDEKTQQIAREIDMVEHELAKLTALELRNRSEQSDLHMMVICEQRCALAELLEQLLVERASRQEDLLRWMREMECARQRDQADFWLVQLQRLLDRKPTEIKQMEATLDGNVISVLKAADAELYAPFFGKAGVTTFEMLRMLNGHDLGKIGVTDEHVRARIITSAASFIDPRYKQTGEQPIAGKTSVSLTSNVATAPNEDEVIAAASGSAAALGGLAVAAVCLHLQKECVVCMDKEATIIFLPCGHACTCSACSTVITLCPMCRAGITQRLPFTS